MDIERLRIPEGSLPGSKGLKNLFSAGFGYRANFTSDTVLSNTLVFDRDILHDQLVLCANNQAAEADPVTNAEPGSIHHELNGMMRGNYSTQYARCDSVAWFLIGHGKYLEETGDWSLVRDYHDQIGRAVYQCAIPHINSDGQFAADFRLSGADGSALGRLDWQDSYTPGRETLICPAVYPHVQALYVNGFRAAAKLLNREELEVIASDMAAALEGLYDDTEGCFVRVKDPEGTVTYKSSDSLALWAYLNWNDVDPRILIRTIQSMQGSETKYGYPVTEPKIAETMTDKNHTGIWIHNQAEIHRAMGRWLRFAWENGEAELIPETQHALEVSSRGARIRRSDYEAWDVMEDGSFLERGSKSQLWGIFSGGYWDKQGIMPQSISQAA